ncbi:MAG: hypothetical protein WCV91_01280 [Candidatus Margulisiibacteriota bacterium]
MPTYLYTGYCTDRASYGRIAGKEVEAKGQNTGEELFSIDLSKESFYYSAEVDTDNDKTPDTQLFQLSKPVKYQGETAVRFTGTPAPFKNPTINPADPNPYIGGLGIANGELPTDLTGASFIEIKVNPQTPLTLVLEIYENDGGDPHSIDKDPNNYYLPKKDDDFFKAVVQLEPTGKWQTLRIPIDKLVDWNRKTAECSTTIPGINENIGDGKFNPSRGEAFAFQLTFVSDSWGLQPKEVYVGTTVRFIKASK